LTDPQNPDDFQDAVDGRVYDEDNPSPAARRFPYSIDPIHRSRSHRDLDPDRGFAHDPFAARPMQQALGRRDENEYPVADLGFEQERSFVRQMIQLMSQL